MAEKPRIRLPKQAGKGEVVEIKTLIAHVMESGQRKDPGGKIVPRKIINRFTCSFNGKPVFECELEPAIAGRFATRTAAATAAPQEIPLRIPSSRARRRAISTDSSFVTSSTASTIARSSVSGMNPAPIP